MRFTERIETRPSAKSAIALGFLAATLLLCQSYAAVGQSTPPPPANPNKPARVRTQLDGFELSPKAGKSANQIAGASRDLGSPKLFAPNLGKAYTPNPEFHWAAAEPNSKVTFRLTTTEGQVVYETATTVDHLRYPGDAPGLTPGGTYRWTIVPENDVLGGAPQPVSFTIVSGAEREAILSDLRSATDAASIAAVFVKHRIWYDAVQNYTDLIARVPDNVSAHAARGELYDQLPATKSLADADWRMVH